MVRALITTAFKLTLRRPRAWILVALWCAAWTGVRLLGPDGVVSGGQQSAADGYQVAFVGSVLGCGLALDSLHRLDAQLRRLPWPGRHVSILVVLLGHALFFALAADLLVAKPSWTVDGATRISIASVSRLGLLFLVGDFVVQVRAASALRLASFLIAAALVATYLPLPASRSTDSTVVVLLPIAAVLIALVMLEPRKPAQR